jgi:menaquinol-cytochrome c reductase iron-sulfur subunit
MTVGPDRGHEAPHTPGPSVWPVAIAIGVAVLLLGLIVNPLVIAPIGAVITIVVAFLWVRESTRELRGAQPHVEPETRLATPTAPAIPADEGGAAMPPPEPGERFPRSRFLEGATLGLGAVIGGAVTVPALGFAVLPAFLHQTTHHVDLGPITDFPLGKYVVATFMVDPLSGEVSRRTAYVRNNGLLDGEPSFTIISNRCAHLGCPVQPNGPIFDKEKKTLKGKNGQEVTLIPSLPAGGFGCPCHGGAYDTEGNRISGPPVRGLDRFEYSIRNGHLWIGRTFSVSHVTGKGAHAKIYKHGLAGPGQHVSGAEAWFYPVQPPH